MAPRFCLDSTCLNNFPSVPSNISAKCGKNLPSGLGERGDDQCWYRWRMPENWPIEVAQVEHVLRWAYNKYTNVLQKKWEIMKRRALCKDWFYYVQATILYTDFYNQSNSADIFFLFWQQDQPGIFIYSRTSMALILLGPWKSVRAMGSSSQWRLIMAPGRGSKYR